MGAERIAERLREGKEKIGPLPAEREKSLLAIK
jgi:hypothetical protein